MDIELVVFDWSGTVIDDRRLVYETIARLLKMQNINVMPFDEWSSFISMNPLSIPASEITFNNYGIGYDSEKLRNMYKEVLNEIVSNGVKSVSYPDAIEVFEYLVTKGKKIAVLSFQPEAHIQMEANEHGLSKFITRIVGSAFDKSNHLIFLCKELNVKPENALFVGDMAGDIQAAKEIGAIPVAVTTGYHSKGLLLAENPNYILSTLSELKDII